MAKAVALRIDGRSDFRALMTKRGGAEATLVAFDLLRLDGEDLVLKPLEARREVLLRLVAGVGGILFSEALAADGAGVFAKACELGLEGIVSKRAGAASMNSGGSRNWLKPPFAVILRLGDDQRTAKCVRRRLGMSDFNVGFVIFPDITQLDFTGPFEVLSRLSTPASISTPSAFAQSRTHIIAKSQVGRIRRPRSVTARRAPPQFPRVTMLCRARVRALRGR